MYSTVLTAMIYGMETRMISVEADVSDGLPMLEMIGFLASEVRDITITKMIQNGVERMAKISLFLPNLRGVP